MRGRHGLVQLLQDLATRLDEGHGCHQADALGNEERVAADVVGVEALQATLGVVLLLLGVVHVVEGLHGAADLFAGHLFEERERKAVGARAVLSRDDERVEMGLATIRLSPKRQTLRHAELQGEMGRLYF